MRFFIPSGSWPYNYEPYKSLCFSMGWSEGNIKNADILILPGGADIGINKERDDIETELSNKWIDKNKPIIGICRGMQMLLHLSGNKIINHIPDIQNTILHTTIDSNWKGFSNWHYTLKLGLLTNSRHHQGFNNVSDDWDVLDYTSDGIIESVQKNNIFAVQWHPERIEMVNTDALSWWKETTKKIVSI